MERPLRQWDDVSLGWRNLSSRNLHVEIHDDEEEVEEWDEKDKAEYKRNKQFEKLTTETITMREKMEKMQLAFCKAQGMDDYLYNMGGSKFKSSYCIASQVQDLRCRKV